LAGVWADRPHEINKKTAGRRRFIVQRNVAMKVAPK
jgi:hypothetical protein